MFYILSAKVSLLDTILRVDFLTSIILGAIGFAVICLARRITKTIRKTNFISSDDRVYVAIKLIGLTLVIMAFLIMLVASLQN